MGETSQPWDGVLLGDAVRAKYDATEWDDQYEDMLNSDVNRGILPNRGNELVGSPGVNQFRVASGAALVKGKWYRNTASVNFAPASASVGHWRRDRLVLSSTWVNINSAARDPAVQVGQTIRLIRLVNPVEDVPAPAITQNDGVLWEIPLFQIQVTEAGVVTVYADDREGIKGTRQFFVPCVGSCNKTDNLLSKIEGDYGWILIDSKLCDGYGFSIVPNDFVAGMTVKAVVVPSANGNIYGILGTGYGQCAESHEQHANDSGYSAVAVTQDNNNCIQQVSLVNAAKGDILRITYRRDAVDALDTVDADVACTGFIVEYR